MSNPSRWIGRFDEGDFAWIEVLGFQLDWRRDESLLPLSVRTSKRKWPGHIVLNLGRFGFITLGRLK